MSGPRGSMRSRTRKIVGFLLAAGVVAAIALVLIVRSPGRPQPAASLPIAAKGAAVEVSETLPAFSLPTPGGGVISTADLKGKPAVVNFFASWCASCWAEIPHIQAAYDVHKGRGLQIVGVGVLDSAESLRWMVDKLHITYPTAYDTGGDTVTKVLRLRSMPTTLFVDRRGIVRARWEGFLDPESLQRLLALIL